MAAPAFQVALPSSTKNLSISIPSKPNAPLSIHLIPSPDSKVFVICLNGLGLPQTSWWPAITQLAAKHKAAGIECPNFLTYDRFGQGMTTIPDPQDKGKEPGHGHDLADVVRDLDELLQEICKNELHKSLAEYEVVLMSSSIGCSVARYYTEKHPGVVSGIILLDATLANSDFVSVFPDPSAPGFDESKLPEGITAESLITARKAIGAIFLPSVPNKEGFSRRNQENYLPLSDGPKLRGKNGGPWVTVVGHDPETFTEESVKMPGVERAPVMIYTNPFWHKYNEDLTKITDDGRGKGPLIAKNAGHFIHKDRPDFVANEVMEILERLGQ